MSDLKQHRPECHSYPLTIPTSVPYNLHASPQIVIAHRGASSHLPEHTIASYRLALELGADYIEPDLVSTKDHHLVAIHSIDLSITTNVESVFGSIKNKTISKYKGKNGLEGYWVYDFTLEEIKKLRVKQRLGSSEESNTARRSTEFDGVFQIPTLIEILELLHDWNENIQPLWYNNNNVDGNNDKSSVILSTNSNNNNNNKEEETQHPKQPHHYPPPPRGIYAELKDFYWLLEDANINLLDILFDQIQITTGTKNNDVWNNALLKNMCNTKILFEHEYRLPPLVIQSFDVEVLKNFTHRWDQIAVTKNENEKSSLTYEIKPNNTAKNESDESDESPIVYNIPLPTPPTILLITNEKCHDEKFWFDIEDNYRDYINGIGPDKNCFFQTTISEKNKDEATQTPSTNMLQLQYVPTIMEKAKENNWVVHPWTERPEKQFLITTDEGDDEVGSSKSSPFRSIIDELIYMKCTIGIHGIFSESVDIAVRVMNMPCRPTDTIDSNIATTTSCPTTTTTGSNSFINEIPIGPVILFSFVSGILTALMILKYCIGSSMSSSSSSSTAAVQQRPQQRRNRNRRRRTGHSVLPTTNTDDDDDNDDHDNDSIVDDNDNDDDDNNEDYDDDDDHDDDTIRVVV